MCLKKSSLLSGFAILITISSLAQQDIISSLAKMEKEFSDYALANGVPEAWTKYFAPDGIMFAPQPVNAIEFMKPRLASKRPRVNRIRWEACFTEVALAGDLGYNIGPSVVENINYDTVPKQYGYIFSVWKKVDNSWRVALDAGIGVKDKALEHNLSGKYDVPTVRPVGKLKDSFLNAETNFSNLALEQGFTTAYSNALIDESQMLKNEWALLKGKKSILEWLEKTKKAESDKIIPIIM